MQKINFVTDFFYKILHFKKYSSLIGQEHFSL